MTHKSGSFQNSTQYFSSFSTIYPKQICRGGWNNIFC